MLVDQFVPQQLHSFPVNIWPWRSWQVFGGSYGRKEG
jgi:hypothetical protein